MTRYAPLWQQANAYPANLDRMLLRALAPYGEATGAAPAAVAGTMNVSIPAGTANVALQAGQGNAFCTWDAAEVVTIGTAPPSGQSRIDRVVCQVRDNAIDGGANNDFVFAVVQGTPAATNPAVPAMPLNAFLMCEVTVPGAVANLNTATVTDRRLGVWLNMPFAAGWGNFGSGFQNPQYRIDGRGRGWLRGMAQYTGSIATGMIATLPVPTAPVANQRYALAASQSGTITGTPFITVTNTGQLNINLSAGTVSNPFAPLDSVGGWDAQGPFW